MILFPSNAFQVYFKLDCISNLNGFILLFICERSQRVWFVHFVPVECLDSGRKLFKTLWRYEDRRWIQYQRPQWLSRAYVHSIWVAAKKITFHSAEHSLLQHKHFLIANINSVGAPEKAAPLSGWWMGHKKRQHYAQSRFLNWQRPIRKSIGRATKRIPITYGVKSPLDNRESTNIIKRLDRDDTKQSGRATFDNDLGLSLTAQQQHVK